jgi:2,3-dihydroxy-p-cumate/2,3-dihydroxybenzoate 3,4-dioxygenase
MVYEYSVGVKHILPEEEASYRPRQFPFAPESFCMWGSKPDIPEFRAEKESEGKKAPLKTVA